MGFDPTEDAVLVKRISGGPSHTELKVRSHVHRSSDRDALAALVRENETIARITGVIRSSLTIEDIYNLGVNSYVTKPVTFESLSNTGSG